MSQKILIILIAGLFLANKGKCQDSVGLWLKLPEQSNSLASKITGERYYLKPFYKGSFFYHDKWLKGNVFLENGEVFKNLDLRLCSYEGQLIYYNKRVKATITIDKHSIKEFNVVNEQGEKEIYKKIYYNRFPKGERYFRLLFDGVYSLYVWYHTVEMKTYPYKDNNNILRDSELVLTKVYFVHTEDKGYIKIASNRASFLQLFPGQKRKIKRAFRRNNISSFAGEPQMIKAFQLLKQEGIIR